jgi:hypothetical protein
MDGHYFKWLRCRKVFIVNLYISASGSEKGESGMDNFFKKAFTVSVI